MILSKQPRHIAIIMDGNGRWAKRKLLPRYAGHQAGLGTVRRIIKYSMKQGVEVLTLFAFSSENWKRPPQEVNLLMKLFMTALQREVKKLHKNNIRLRLIGNREAFSEKLQGLIADAEELTKDNTKFTLVIAANYGGRWDIADTAKRLALKVQQGSLKIEDIDENLFNSQINLNDLPEPDLFIRTGGEQRISNFLLWQLAYTEMYFTNTLWPDFNEENFMEALKSFGSRERRFGRISEQLKNA
ncbi:polyprenyl diphosphate synthase [Candidatus Marithrix sp. Canyon 246]|uniref:polyprenyl diphosphate synthase n=1 Tax=Candidatus Marithrix sp. Canyon 246 TaxID=1827136 RepID=UPI00084A2371|nr:polyprenyl diphosphate synthase [Candidatus Marithrix sp. Canyon 246]